MEKKVANPSTQIKNPPNKPRGGESTMPTKPPTAAPQSDVVATTAVQTETPIPPAVQLTSKPAVPTKTPASAIDLDDAAVMHEFLRRFGGDADASALLDSMSAANKEVPTLAPLKIPPRPSDFQEISTTQTLTSHTENPQFPTDDPISDQPHAEELADPEGITGDVEDTEEEEGVPGERNEGDEEVGEVRRRDGEETEGIEGGVIGDDGEGREIDEGVDLGNDFVENVDDENPTEGNDEGETPEVIVEGETPIEIEERHPDEGKSLVTAEVEEPESGRLKDIVDLVDKPESDDTPVKERIARRMTRGSSMLNEVDEITVRCPRGKSQGRGGCPRI